MIAETELQQLCRALELGEGCFALHFVVCNTPAIYPPLLESLRAACQPPIYPCTIPRDLDTLIDVWLSEQVRDLPPNAVIFLYGLADLLMPQQDETGYLKRHNILQQLNWQRNAYQRLQRTLVVWVRSDAMRLVACYASDFYDWRTGVFEYRPPSEQRHEVVQQNLVGFDREWNAIAGLPLAEKQRWSGVLQGLIDELADPATPAEQQMLAKLLNDQGELYYSLGEYKLAKPCYDRALAIRERLFGRNHQDVAEVLNNLANLYRERGQYDQALPLYQEALKIRGQVLGKQHPSYATSLNNLAGLYYSQGQYEQALPLYQEASKIVEQALGKQHPYYATSLNNLAKLYYSQGQYEQALPLYQEASKIREQVLGKQHPYYAQSLNNLAALYRAQGQYDQALPLFQEALKIYEQVLGKKHPDYALSLDNLAGLYYSQGQHEQALPLFQEALKILTEVLGEQHPNTQKAKQNYSDCLSALGTGGED